MPIFWSILTWSAHVTFHDRVDVLSELRTLVKTTTGGVPIGGADPAAVVTDLVTVPEELLALKVKTVDVPGDTTLVPEGLT
jgi:hypothetical protein